VCYVITLDADTSLPQGSAARLIGAMAHPISIPEVDPENGHVNAGYTVLQPRTEIMPAHTRVSRFTSIFAGDTGLDLYTHAVSDVYQDLFSEGIYVGKGIYDVQAFAHSTSDQIPENTLLSHDLLEGVLGRAGLASDIILYESFPPNYLAYTRRQHRWIRGDWQLLPWLLSLGANVGNDKRKLGLLDRWKITDNLRRSLYAPALLFLLILSWLWLPGSPLVWAAAALIISLSPLITVFLGRRLQRDKEQTQIEAAPTDPNLIYRWLLSLAFLPYEALLSLSAMAITLIRVVFTKRKMLEWQTSASAANLLGNIQNSVLIHWRDMIGAPFTAIVVGLMLVFSGAMLSIPTLLVAIPFLLVWLAAPQIAAWLDEPLPQQELSFTEDETKRLRSLARRTWFFFEQFVGPEDHWLPPDHFQETPRGTVAHRTSTTNIGLGMLSTLAAYDMGYTGLQDLLQRLRNVTLALDNMEMYRGHFLNWYDTRSLAPLPPRYISTVDNGNLIGSLIALRQGVKELPDRPIQRWENWQGLIDTLNVFRETLRQLESQTPEPHALEPVAKVCQHITQVEDNILAIKDQPERWGMLLEDLNSYLWRAIELELVQLFDPNSAIRKSGAEYDPQLLRSVRLWAARVRFSLNLLQREQRDLSPWVGMMVRPPALLANASLNEPIGEVFASLRESLHSPTTLRKIHDFIAETQEYLDQICKQIMDSDYPAQQIQETLDWCTAFADGLKETEAKAMNMLNDIDELTQKFELYIEGMDFSFLYNPRRNVFYIGYNLETQRMDANYYDLLASEARIASLVAISKRDVPVRHWLYLGRPLTRAGNRLSLLSWSGTMFEYLMPSLLVREYPNSLLNESAYGAVQRQIEYGKENDVPWGISESGFYFFDSDQNYQYRAFGTPGLGFKRGLAEDLVIAPYASLLALPFAPTDVLENMNRLDEIGMLADYGYYEAIDYTPERMSIGQHHAIVRSFMAHHQGMVLLQLVNVLQGNRMVNRFHANTRVQSVELLLQEQIPRSAPIERIGEEIDEAPADFASIEPQIIAEAWRSPVESATPRVHYLSNSRYSVMITNRGSGFSRLQDKDLTRWRADATRDDWGTYTYLQDLEDGTFWTAGGQLQLGDQREVTFLPHQADFSSSANDLNLSMQVTVPPEDDLEIRRVRVANTTDRPRRVALVSYGELVLAPMDADRRHPAFNKLIIESTFLANLNGLLFRRRPRAASDVSIFLVHAFVSNEKASAALTGLSYESSRLNFLGRGRNPRMPIALENAGENMQESTGYVLDPVFALRVEFEIPAHDAIEAAFITTAGDSRQQVLTIVRRYRDWNRVERAYDHARLAAEIEMRRMDIRSSDIEQYQNMLSALFYPQMSLRAGPELLAANVKGQPALWAYGISGDYPILLLKVSKREEITLLRELLRAHNYWRSRGLLIDLVIINEKEAGYSQEVHDRIFQLLLRTNNDGWLNRRGGIFLLRDEALNDEDHILLETVARVVLNSDSGSLADQVQAIHRIPVFPPPFTPIESSSGDRVQIAPVARPADLVFDNGTGGFTPDGREYVIYIEPNQLPPAPWINVIANEAAGFWVSESGGGYTWAINSGENRLTPWSNDPVSDQPGEAIYLRDEETAEIWSPTPLPAGTDAPYLVRHGAGYSIFEHNAHGLRHELLLFVPKEEPLKIAHLKLENKWQRARRITVTYYAEWVLGVNRDQMAPYIIPEYENERRAILARNPYPVEFAERVAFLSASKEPHGLTTSRGEFLGRSGTYRRPAALDRVGLSGEIRAGEDPCAALQIHIDLEPGETQEVYFLIGQGQNRDETLRLIDTFCNSEAVYESFQEVTRNWDKLLGKVQVRTPDQAMDFILNRWLLYQGLACRIWGRSALYQSSGAIGFRDQLQDVMALFYSAPEIARQQIVSAARHQFEQGDVLHWWHPPSGRGVRTRHSDDLLWMPYVAAEYLTATGDRSVLEEQTPFMVAEELGQDEEDRYGEFPSTSKTYNVYEHCLRAIRRASTSGSHGLPLIGTGDWNDGMNRVGAEGKGESIWLGWFLYSVLDRFIPICRMMDDDEQAQAYQRQAERLRAALHEHGWDGQWYLRAFYDNGDPLGASTSQECQIDAIAQSWAVLSNAGQDDRDRQAMQSVLDRLVQKEGQLVRLFIPAFNQSTNDPGYIKAYPPGVRENGGQYTHAATWTVWAFTQMGDGDTAGELYKMINPVYHGHTPEMVEQYKVEPYVIAADVYSEPPHVGRGGWTWYTGSSGWLYRLGIEAILGLKRVGSRLVIDPCIPTDWTGYEMVYQYGEHGTRYHIRVENPQGANTGVARLVLDNNEQDAFYIPLEDDGAEHHVTVHMAKGSPRPAVQAEHAITTQPKE
jgi:cyclic beta-1,2-glucan synthetase